VIVLGHPVYRVYVRTYAVWSGATHMRAFPCRYVHSFKHTSTSLYAVAEDVRRRGDRTVGRRTGRGREENRERERERERERVGEISQGAKRLGERERQKGGEALAVPPDAPRHFSRPGRGTSLFREQILYGRAVRSCEYLSSYVINHLMTDDGILRRRTSKKHPLLILPTTLL